MNAQDVLVNVLQAPLPIIPAPTDRAAWTAWRAALKRWRATTLAQLHYDDVLYCRDDFAWVQSCFSCAFVMMNDLAFHDPQAGQFTARAFVEAGLRDFGGYDALVLWHAYPNIGFDDRNQFDFYRDMPGGLSGLRRLSRELRAGDVRVFIAYNPWDTGTRREGRDDLEVLVEFVGEIEADGIFLDTLKHGAPEFRARLDASRAGVVLESEIDLPVEFIHTHHMSWAQWFHDSETPGVLRNTWLERRHKQHGIHRWDRDHSAEIHTAWMNGSGIMVWENVFGSWVGWHGRDRSLLRSMLPLQRRYAGVFAQGEWTPLVTTACEGVYASLWQAPGVRLWTLVNRTERDVNGVVLRVPANGQQFFDGVRGLSCAGTPGTANAHRGADLASFEARIPARGISAFIGLDTPQVDAAFQAFLHSQADTWLSARFDTEYPARPVRRVPASKAMIDSCALPRAMQPITGLHRQPRELTVHYRVRECGFYDNTPYVNVWPPLKDFHQVVSAQHQVELGDYAIDITPVTNAQFQAFLQTTGYTPRHIDNFLKHWRAGAPPPDHENAPVVYIDLDDARAYARWVGKRLPTEDEWQYATTQYRALQSAVWEWTESEHTDDRTRFVMLKGGSGWHATSSDWYADGGQHAPDFAAKFLLMWSGLDRCGTIGFRCAADLL